MMFSKNLVSAAAALSMSVMHTAAVPLQAVKRHGSPISFDNYNGLSSVRKVFVFCFFRAFDYFSAAFELR